MQVGIRGKKGEKRNASLKPNQNDDDDTRTFCR